MKTAEPKTIPAATQNASQPFFPKRMEAFSLDKCDPQVSFFNPAPNYANTANVLLQPKLKIGGSNDQCEQEADSVAGIVSKERTSTEPSVNKEPTIQPGRESNPITHLVQPKFVAGAREKNMQKEGETDVEPEPPLELQHKPVFEGNTQPPDNNPRSKGESGGKVVQRKCADCEMEEKLQTKSKAQEPARASHKIENKLKASVGRGNPLPSAIQTRMENAFGADFSNVLLHTDNHAVQMNKDLQAQAFTTGNDIYFNSGKYDVESQSGKFLLAHELTHTIQQSGTAHSNVPLVQRKQALEDPGRFGAVNRNLFSNATGTRQPWVEPTSADQIFQEFKSNFPEQPPLRIPTNTTESQAETDALVADQRIRTVFSEITNPVSESRLRDAVQIMDSSFFQDEDFRRAWLANEMIKFTAIETFEINETDARFKALQDRLFNDPDVGDDIENKMRLISAFAKGDNAADREIFLNRGISAAQRMLTLIHEIVHFYAHDQYREWMDQSTASRFYNEGITELLARRVMTPDELRNRTSYQERVDAARSDILAFASESDLSAAFFKGEVWRLEHDSDEAKEAFANQLGIQPNATRAEENSLSRTNPGINQTVVEGRHFRFMNIGDSQSNPKPEHVAFLQNLITNVILPDTTLQLRFVGHASSTGSIAFNRELSRQRVNAFYQLARDAGVPETQLINPDNPEFEGELSATAGNDSIIGRAMNRRVELFIVPPQSSALEDNIFHLERLRGQGVQEDGIAVSNDTNAVFKNSPNPAARLPFTPSGWNANDIMTQLGQHDILGGTDSDSLRCVQAVAMASYIPGGPDAVVRYLAIIIQDAQRTRTMNPRRRKAIEVINFVSTKISARTATFGDLSWAQEAVHDLFFDDVSGTDAREIINQISPNLDTSRTTQTLDIWTNSSTELMAAIQGIQPGEQFIVNSWKVLFDQAYEELRDQGEPTQSPMRVNVNGRVVTISELNPTSRPAHTDIDENRDKKSGHQLLIFMDNSSRIWFYEPEIQETGRHLFEVTNDASLFDPYFTELVDIETYEYIQIIGKIIPVTAPSGTP